MFLPPSTALISPANEVRPLADLSETKLQGALMIENVDVDLLDVFFPLFSKFRILLKKHD